MAGSASPLGIDDDDSKPLLEALRPKRFSGDRVEELKDDSIPSVDLETELNKEAQETPPGTPRPEEEQSPGAVEAAVAPPPVQPPAPPPPPPVLDEPPAAEIPGEVRARGRILSTATTRASELDSLLIDAYETAWLTWLPETIWDTLRKDFGVPIAQQNHDKIMAAKLLHVSDSFWRSWEIFEKVLIAFNGGVPLFDRVQDPSLGQIAWGMVEAGEMRKEEYQDEILGYIAARAKEEGVTLLIDPLDVAQERLDEILPPEIVPLRKELSERWNAFEGADLGNLELKEDFFGVQIARLAGIRNYLESAGGPE